MVKQYLRAVVVATGVLLSSTIGHAQIIAYDAPLQNGNQDWRGNLGLDFDVNSPITVLKLGAFDNNGDGFTGSVRVAIFSRTTRQAVTRSLTFSGTAGTLVNGDRFLALANPVVLSPGQYSVVAVGFNNIDLNGNAGLSPFTASAMNTGRDAISFTGTARYNDNPTLGFPDFLDTGPANRYLAGTFQFTTVPVAAPILKTWFETPFGFESINLGETTTLKFQLENPNAVSLTGLSFSDTAGFPAGLVIATPNGLTGSCPGATITAAAGSSSISLAGATLGANASCTFSVDVVAIAQGQQNNTTSAVTSNEALPGEPASASLFVYNWWLWWFAQ